jgi:DNA polymerase-1
MGMFSVLPEPVRVADPDEALEVVERLRAKPILAVDTETTGLSRQKDRAIILAISDGEERWAIWPEVIPYFKDLLEDPEIKLIMHNANFDCWMLLNIGIDVYRHAQHNHYRVYDTMVMHALVDDTLAHDLKFLSKHYLGIDMVPFKAVFGKQLRKRKLHEVLLDAENEDIVCNYAALDAYATYKLFFEVREELLTLEIPDDEYPTLWDYYVKTELPFTRVLWEMERHGVVINRDDLLEQAPIIEDKLLSIQKWFGRATGRLYVNLKSNDQMGEFFFGDLGRRPLSHTEKGKPQLNKDVLGKWAKDGCDYAEKLLEYRDLDKKLGTYISNLLEKIHVDGKIHASFNQTGARTGRLSSSDPNLQNQPPYIRSAYLPSSGYTLLAADYAQLEMRILAHLSGDNTLSESIRSGLDVHSSTAAKMFKVPYEDIIKARRKDDNDEEISEYEKKLLGHRKGAKAINFGLMYGQGAGALAGTLGCHIDEARLLIKQYFSAFPKVTKYFKRAIGDARDVGFCSTILGRRRLVPGLRSRVGGDVAQAERKVKNSPIQGSAADITKMAMVKLWEDPLVTKSGCRMIIQVHDEIVFEIPNEWSEDKELNERIAYLMGHPFYFDLDVPLETTSKYGSNWLECK